MAMPDPAKAALRQRLLRTALKEFSSARTAWHSASDGADELLAIKAGRAQATCAAGRRAGIQGCNGIRSGV